MPHIENYDLLEIPNKFLANKTEETALITPSGTIRSTKFDGFVLHRDKWLQYIISESERDGAEIWTESKAISINDDQIQILKESEKVQVRAKVIIGADGTASRVARWMDMPRRLNSLDLCPVKQHLMKNVKLDPSVVEMYLGQKYAPGAYSWIIPRGKNEANVGIGYRRDYIQSGDTMTQVLDRFINEHPIAKHRLENATIESTITGIVPVTKPAEYPGDTVRGRVMLVGDSARQVIAFVGAGIPPSIITGTLAGRIANDHIKHGTPLIQYEIEWKKQLLGAFKNGYWLKALWDRLLGMRDERKIEWFFNRLSDKDLTTIFRNKIPLKLKIGKYLIFLLEKMI
jgi:digeranylgeranylglycerophospholipid reductase